MNVHRQLTTNVTVALSQQLRPTEMNGRHFCAFYRFRASSSLHQPISPTVGDNMNQ